MEMTGTLGRASILAGLVLAVVICAGGAPVEDQAADHCDGELMDCLNQNLVRFHDTNTMLDSTAACSILKDFSDCVSSIACLTPASREELVTNFTASFNNLGFPCDPEIEVSVAPLPSDGSSPRDTGLGDACSEARNNCTTTLVQESFQSEANSAATDMKDWFCPGLNKYLDCLMDAPCDMDNYGQTVRQEIELKLQQAGITCDINTQGDLKGNDNGEEKGNDDIVDDKKDDMEGSSTEKVGGDELDVKYETHVEEQDDEEAGEAEEGDSETGEEGDNETEEEGDNQSEEEGGPEVEGEGEQAEATLQKPKDSAPSLLSATSGVTSVVLALVTCLALIGPH